MRLTVPPTPPKRILVISDVLQIRNPKTEYRIRRAHVGWVIEKKKVFIIFPYWVHAISVSGIPKIPWYYSEYRFARIDFDKLISGNTYGLQSSITK